MMSNHHVGRSERIRRASICLTALVLLSSILRGDCESAHPSGSDFYKSGSNVPVLRMRAAEWRETSRGGGGGSRSSRESDLSSDTCTGALGVLRVAYQGEPGAYSEKSTRELLGQNVVAVGYPNFEACFRAVASMECDYACLPIENSLGGSIHDNYDLMLRYDLTIVAEHEFRVNHCLLVKPGVKREDIKYAISHPQALAQCDNFLRGLGITPIGMYDTAGSAKLISEGGVLPDQCTPENTAAIASDLAGRTYGLSCLNEGIEDDDTNFTRFLLLARKAVVHHLTKSIPAKTSVVFTLPDTPGALYKALACFSLRDIDFSKIESRPTSASLLNFLKFRSQQSGKKSQNKAETPRFRYCFYLDFLANQLDENAQNALANLREQADYLRILGSYPQKSRLVGPVKEAAEQLKHLVMEPNTISVTSVGAAKSDAAALNIGIVGFGPLGQYLAKRLSLGHRVSCMDGTDKSLEANKLGVEFFHGFDSSRFFSDVDVVILTVPLTALEDTIQTLPVNQLRGKLLVEMGVLNAHPKAVMLQAFGDARDIDIMTAHPMFGAGCGSDNPYTSSTWDGRPIVYEKVRISNVARCESFLKIFEDARCRMVEMDSDQHDKTVADAEFVTHLTGRLLVEKQLLPPSPVSSKEYAALCDVAEMTSGDTFDLFFGMFKYNGRARDHLNKMRDNLASLERQLVAKESYIAASTELRNNDRQRLLAETKLLLQEVTKNGGLFDGGDAMNQGTRKIDSLQGEPMSTTGIAKDSTPSTPKRVSTASNVKKSK